MSRLEEIKEELFEIELPDYIENHIHWLISRVEELEEEIYQDTRQAVLEGLYEENNRYKQALETIAAGDNHVAEFWDIAKKALEESE